MKTKSTLLIGILLACAASVLAQSGGKAEPNRITFTKGKLNAIGSGALSNN